MRPVIIFAGTTEGRRLSEYLTERKVPVTACVATEYGETLLTETEYLKVHAGRMDEAAMGQFFEEQKTEHVDDATHPYAAGQCRKMWQQPVKKQEWNISA